MGLPITGHWGGKEIRAEDCELCVHITKGDKKISTTLIFYSYYECQGTQKETRTYDQTQYQYATQEIIELMLQPK